MNWGRSPKRPFKELTFQPSSPNGARLRLIEINGVLFAFIKCRMQRKRHRTPSHDKTSGLSFDTTMYPHEYKRELQMNKQNERKKTENNKMHKDRPAGLKAWKSFSYTIITTKNSCFYCAVALRTMQNALLVISKLT
jgi:hypothetical protein